MIEDRVDAGLQLAARLSPIPRRRRCRRRVDIVRGLAISPEKVAAVERDERRELERQAWAACQVTRASGAEPVVLAVPVAPAGWTTEAGDIADEFVAVTSAESFRAVGHF